MAFGEVIVALQSMMSFTMTLMGLFCFFYRMSILMESRAELIVGIIKVVNVIVIMLTFTTFLEFSFFPCSLITIENVLWAVVLWSGFPKTTLNSGKQIAAILVSITTHIAWMIYLVINPPTMTQGLFVFVVLIWLSPILIASSLMKNSNKGRGKYVGFWKETFQTMGEGFSHELSTHMGAPRRV